ncbi:hypothetical protein GH714_020665 [Hevea brasiliensis]|uniref:Uncharacterized protein n=1 Tax=Hevea brasiliensis TaxID=3981 RepID=A0A6A6LKW2_HEVBR|nr:hypothetical protein GH714_020665 [Hevea brasiliensis]
MASSDSAEETIGDNSAAVAKADNNEMEFNRVNCLLWVLHESAASFSIAIQSLKLPGRSAELAMAWNGKDVHEWHKRIAYQVAVYALLKTAIEVEILLSLDRHNNASPVKEILTPKINLVGEYIESQLNMKHADLVQWFRVVELPRIAGFFIPLLRKWSAEYAGSGVAGIIVAISCCAAVAKLGSGRISCPMFTLSVEDVLVELMVLSHSLVEVDKLHQLATEAGFELNFLSHFGAKVLPCNKIEELEFWIGLAQRKLSVAFSREMVVRGTENSHEKVQTDSLATLGLFAFLGRKTRLIFLSRMNVKDLDELVKDLLNYLECGILFIYPELASISAYECFMESLLTVCLEDYRAVYARPCELPKIADAGASDRSLSVGLKGTEKLSVPMEAQQNPTELMLQGCIKVKSQQGIRLRKAGNFAVTEVITLMEASGISIKSSPLNESLLRRYSVKLASTSSDVCMGTQLLFVDIMDALGLVLKQLRGQKISRRQRRKLKRTLTDIATLIPITILMLIPVSAVGHAAMLAVIKNYMPSLIPSPYSSERLDVVKQLNRTKKMEVQSWSNLQDPSSIINLDDQSSNPVV